MRAVVRHRVGLALPACEGHLHLTDVEPGWPRSSAPPRSERCRSPGPIGVSGGNGEQDKLVGAAALHAFETELAPQLSPAS